MAKGFKKASTTERTRAMKERTQKGAPYIQSELDQFIPLEGDNCIRIVPPLADDNMATLFGLDIWAYYVGGKAFLDPRTFDPSATNPAFEEYKKLKLTDPEEAKKLSGTKRTLMFILDLNNGDDKAELKLWLAPPSLIDDIIRVAKNKRTGELIALEDPDDGRPVFFERTGTGRNTEYKGVAIDQEKLPLDDSLLDKMPYFEDILVKPDITDMEIAIRDELSKGEEDEEEEGRFRRGRRKKEDQEEEEEKPSRNRRPSRQTFHEEEATNELPFDEEDQEEEEKPSRNRQPSRQTSHEEEEEAELPANDHVDNLRNRLRSKLKS